MWITKQYFINRVPVLSFSISVKNFTETRSPYYAWGNRTIPYPWIFKVRVKMYMTSRRTLTWDCSRSSNPKKKSIFPLIGCPLILSKPFSSERNESRIQVPHVELPPTPPKLITTSVLLSNTLLIRWQTNTQTNLFNLVRPSFQSRKLLWNKEKQIAVKSSIRILLFYSSRNITSLTWNETDFSNNDW